MEREKFSVLISVYRKEKPEYFDVALKSIYEQTVRPDEVVICADGELTPDLDAIIKKYRSLYPDITKIIRFKSNRGLGLTLHDGLLKCSNNIVFRMDSDDISVNDRFEKQLNVLRGTDIDIVGSNITEYDDEMQRISGLRKVPEKDEEIKRYAKRRNPMNHMTVCFRKNKVLEAGNYLNMIGFEDYYLWVRMMQAGCKFFNIQESLVDVRGGRSMAERRGGKAYVGKIKNFEKKLREMDFISLIEYCENISIRFISSAIPATLRNKLYNSVLRSSR